MVDSNGWKIKASGKAVVDPGFSILYTSEKKDVILPPLNKGDQVDITGSSIRKGQTTPPDRYTDKSLLDAMANAASLSPPLSSGLSCVRLRVSALLPPGLISWRSWRPTRRISAGLRKVTITPPTLAWHL